mgnify:CR=1 FL=1
MSTKETPQTIDPYLVISQIEKLLAQLKLENAEKTKSNNITLTTCISYTKEKSTTLTNYNELNAMPSSILVEIGVKDLFNPSNTVNGEVPKSEFVNYTEVVFHEKQHVRQRMDLFLQKKPEKWIVDMARHDVITRFFPGYYLNNYWNQALELDAEENGIKETAKYFDTHHFNGNTPEYDARTILFEDRKNSYKWYLPRNKELSSYKEMLDKLQLRKKLITRQLQSIKPIKYNVSDPEDVQKYAFSEKFFTNPEYENHRQAYENATDGIERDKVLLQAILREYQLVPSIPKCLESECKAYRKAFKHTDKSMVIPSSKVYSIMSQEDVHADRINHLEDKFGDVLAADKALEHEDSQYE